ncbi:bacterial Ig-like domain-containing protein, partial [Listeria monocytogenes]|uniref:bacterial Ig-like domain-containing protein n=1 Tax=Listeria monocytogenes TaxID=1639 RepID=UPI0034A3B0DB
MSHVTVLENHAKIIVADSKLKANAKCDPKDNFVRAMSRDGSDIPLSNVKVEGKDNTKKPGTYKITYTIDPNEGTADAGKEELSDVAMIQVEGEKVTVKHSDDDRKIEVKAGKQRTETNKQA